MAGTVSRRLRGSLVRSTAGGISATARDVTTIARRRPPPADPAKSRSETRRAPETGRLAADNVARRRTAAGAATRDEPAAEQEHRGRDAGGVARLNRSPLWSRPGFLIRRLNQIHYALFFTECQGTNITPVQYGLLTILNIYPGLDQVSLAAELGIDRTNVGDVLRRLAARGLVRRAIDVDDKRQKVAFLTEKGAALTRDMLHLTERAGERLLEPLPPAERRRFLKSLNRLLEGNNEFGRTLFRPG
jgi:DNA-binding MarR family transcriptional regulator